MSIFAYFQTTFLFCLGILCDTPKTSRIKYLIIVPLSRKTGIYSGMGASTFKQKTSEEGTRIFSGTTQLYYTTRNLLWAGLKSHLHLLQEKQF